MKQAFIVIGANYGDEGKGLATSCLAQKTNGKKLNILINGGAQRGHTVERPDGVRHVFHHFGSASFDGAESYADEDFIVNPLLFMDEYIVLRDHFALTPRLTLHGDCRVSTVYDMMLGQIIEENRGSARHGSCGLGIFETVLRYKSTSWAKKWRELKDMDWETFRAYCRRIRDEYIPKRLSSLGMSMRSEWQSIVMNEELIGNSFSDLKEMASRTQTASDWKSAAQDYDVLLFEAGQGLMLDEENKADFPHLTPSRTTSLVSAGRISALGEETRAQVVYVTRAYFTRHGAGPFPNQCPKEQINSDMVDKTNVPNPHQQTLRYGFFDETALLNRTKADFVQSRKILPSLKSSLMITHLNETDGALAGEGDLNHLLSSYDKAYTSCTPYDMKEA